MIASFFFTIQIYCDFSGYSDIAIGTSKVMGFDSMINFNKPYFAKSVSEFWRRWHISLSTWFRDYLYIPLGGNRVSKWRLYTNLMIVFLISGLWHGANWTFVVWGALHGLYILCSMWTKGQRGKVANFLGVTKIPALHGLIQVIITFSLVSFAWIFFRAGTLNEAFYISTHLFSGTGEFLVNVLDAGYIRSLFSQLGMRQTDLIIAFITIGILFGVDFIYKGNITKQRFAESPVWFRWAAYYTLAGMILFLGSFNETQGFIYLQF